MSALRAEMIDHAQGIRGEIGEGERALTVLRFPVPARIRRATREFGGERGELVVPMRPVAADAVEEDDERTVPSDARGKTRSLPDMDHPSNAPLTRGARARWNQQASGCPFKNLPGLAVSRRDSRRPSQ